MLEAGAFFTKRSLEQCSSEDTARYKAGLFSGNRMLSLASGLGVDDIAFSTVFDEVVSVDPDTDLNRIVRYNLELLKISKIKRLDSTAEAFLESGNGKFDLVYMDPDRRSDAGRQILLKDHVPDAAAILEQLFAISPAVLIKCSPMYDYNMARREIKGISRMYSLSRHGEMKELLLLAERDCKPGQALMITCADIISPDCVREYTAAETEPDTCKPATELKGFLHEAGSSLIKMRMHHVYAGSLGLMKLDNKTGFYCSDSLPQNFIGKSYRIIGSMPYKPAVIKQYLKENQIQKANTKARGLAFSTAEMAARIGIRDGGVDFLFALPFQGKAVLLHCRSVEN